jgi:hypothetical protein
MHYFENLGNKQLIKSDILDSSLAKRAGKIPDIFDSCLAKRREAWQSYFWITV